jgi:poly-gamma-glutamate capsule biosynthesis protein CapA/YwtB (metallophosphatase superfamily)
MKIRSLIQGALATALLLLSGCAPAPKTVITFGGDIMLAREGKTIFADVNPWTNIERSIQQQWSSTEDAYFFANLESPINATGVSTAAVKGYDLCAGSDQLETVQEGKINFVDLSNNHKNDCGTDPEGSTTSDFISEAGLDSVGPDLTPVYLESDNGTIGVVSAEDVSGPIDEVALLQKVSEARKNCDLLIAALHWGNEYQQGITNRQEELAQALADAGVDILWGTHPHVLQKVEWLHSTKDNHQMLVMYSLGNLLSDQWMSSQTRQTALITVTIQNKQISQISILPIQIQHSTRQLERADKTTTASIEQALGIDQLNFSIPKGN